MSHTVTVTRTTTTATTSAILLNIGYFKKPPGILKLLHVLLGIVTVGILGNYIGYLSTSHYGSYLFVPELFFLLIATTCLITSALLLFSCFVSIATATILPKTIFEIFFHGFATIFLLISAAIYLAKLHDHSYIKQTTHYTPRLAAGELVYFSPLSFLLFVSSTYCFQQVIYRNAIYVADGMTEPGYGAKIFVSIIGIINAVLYAMASYFSWKGYKMC